MTDGIVVLGAGGHARVVIGALEAAGLPVAALYDDGEKTWGTTVLGRPVRGPIATVVRDGFRQAVAAIGDNAVRSRVVGSVDLQWVPVVHPRAWVHSSALIGPGAVVFAGAVVQPEARIGAHAIVNTGATVDHECVIEDFAHIAPGVHLGGRVRVGRGALVGIGSSAVQCVRIGEWSTVGAGAAVVRDVPSHTRVLGVPARPR